MNSLTREQRMLGAAGASILFIISLFFSWFGSGPISFSGQDIVPSWWILLIFAAGAAALLIADAFNFELPAAINPASWAAYLTSVTFIVTLMIFLEGGGGAGRKFGLWLALLFSLVAVALAVYHWREEAK
ncbi:MAG: hypothetical protein AB7V62_16505 [Thermoleophilia bacterium]